MRSLSAPPASPHDDPFLAEKIERVIARYRHLWTEEEARAFREAAFFTLTTHPDASKMVERERAATAERSGTRRKHPGASDPNGAGE